MMQGALVHFQNLTAEELKTAPPSYKFAYVQQGDIVYIPAGSIVCEKAVGGHSLVLRAYSMLLSQANADGCMFLAGASGPGGKRILRHTLSKIFSIRKYSRNLFGFEE